MFGLCSIQNARVFWIAVIVSLYATHLAIFKSAVFLKTEDVLWGYELKPVHLRFLFSQILGSMH